MKKKNQPKSFLLKPMFPRYLFIRINTDRENWASIQSTRGVSHLVIFGDTLAEVPKFVVKLLKTKVDEYDIAKQKVIKKKFQKGDKLVIKKGVFQGNEATFFSATGKERVRILLQLMNKLIITEVPEQDIGRNELFETFKL